ncbi:MAG: carboxypeptidase-like regulatory domain-containing protein [Planctomycetota bacterium]
MRLAYGNEGKGRWFASAWRALTLSSAIAVAPRAQTRASEEVTLCGQVVVADGAPAGAVEVAFHYRSSAGVPWLRSAVEQVEVVKGRSDNDGNFVLCVPAQVAGTCVAWRDQLRGAALGVVGGDRVRVCLARAAARTFELDGAGDATLDVVFEAVTPLAPARVSAGGGRLSVPSWPGIGAVVLLPQGRLTRGGRMPWFGASGADRRRVRTHEAGCAALDLAWAAPLELPVAVWRGTTRLPVAGDLLWRGQLRGGQPFVARGTEVMRAPCATPRRLGASGRDAVVAVGNVEVDVGDDSLVFTVAEALGRDGEAFVVPGWLPADALLLARNADGWCVLGEGAGDGGHLTVTVRGDDREPVAGAVVRVRPHSSRPREPWHGFPGLELVTDRSGDGTLPVRLAGGEYEWIVMAPDGRSAHGRTSVVGGDVTLPVELTAGGAVRGLVVDADGEPIAGLMVELHGGDGDEALSFGWPEHRTHTGADGEFCLRGLRVDHPYELVCGSAAWGEVTADGVRAGQDRLALQLRPPAAPR